MYAPTKIWRRWHRKVNINIKRYALVSALAATAEARLVMARGHDIEDVPEIPLVLEDSIESVSTTAKAQSILQSIGAGADMKRSSNSRQVLTGHRKIRSVRHKTRKGPMVVCANDHGISRAFRNLPAVDVARVDSLNLIKLAPGGCLGRFLIWTESAIEALDRIFGRYETPSQVKKGYLLPRVCVTTPWLARLINSDEIQTVVNAPKDDHKKKHAPLKKNPLRNSGTMFRLNPYAAKQDEKKKRGKKVRYKKRAKAFYNEMLVDSDYQNEGCKGFQAWLGLHSA